MQTALADVVEAFGQALFDQSFRSHDNMVAFQFDQDAATLGGAGQLLPYDAPKGFLDRLGGPLNVLPQDLIDDALVVAAARSFNLLAEPGKNLDIQTDCDPRFPLGNRNNSSSLRFPEIIFTLHDLPRIGSFLGPWHGARKSSAHDPTDRCKRRQAGVLLHPCQE